MIRIVSPDDHLVEPPELWTGRLPAKDHDAAPHVRRERGEVVIGKGDVSWRETSDGAWADVWHYEDMRIPQMLTNCGAGVPVEEMSFRPMTYDEMRPGFYRQRERLEDMDLAGIEACVCYPNIIVRFCGQRFLAAKDKDLALRSVRAYNDFQIEEWAAGSDGRLIPLGILPLWDAELAAEEVHRLAARGVRAVSFSEQPADLGLPSIHSGGWAPFFQACQDEDMILSTHIGSSSTFLTTSPGAPDGARATIMPLNSIRCMVDWLTSGLFISYPNLRVVLAECEIGWVPFFLNKLDHVWEHRRAWNEFSDKLPNPPSSYVRDHMYFTFFDDKFGLDNIDAIGPDNVMFETDYPHQDTNWPNSQAIGAEQTKELSPELAEKVLRGNALSLFHSAPRSAVAA